ncbi:MAG TPA: type II toxin-antitoxin system PemK/MazF family toxin [Pirellulales bacterium]|jgi:uncharacterized protein YifN (PemK superfamily)|nr:type II toxin-antitoxin system PemK/MazF family toxin [Pirellulales bacterium]
MAITFHPQRGTLLMCDFNTGFLPPEMVKKRPVVVLSSKHRCLAVVIPLSATEPNPLEPCHHEMSPDSFPTSMRGVRRWAKCDMIAHVAFRRLDRVMDGKDPKTGKRIYVAPTISDVDLSAIEQAVRHVLGL